MFNPDFESMPVTKLKELQLERLKWSVRHAYENNAVYKRKFDAAGFHPDQLKSLDDLRRVPFLTKHEMREASPFGLFAKPMKDVVRLHSSSGTTGNATVVGYTRQDLDTWATLIARCLSACGATEEDIVQVAYGYGLFTGGLGLHYGVEKLGRHCGAHLRRQYRSPAHADPGLRHHHAGPAPPSYAINMIDFAAKQMPDFDFKKSKLRRAIFGAEPWTEAMRKEIETRMGIDAYDIYGLSEVMGSRRLQRVLRQAGPSTSSKTTSWWKFIDPETGEVLPEGEPGRDRLHLPHQGGLAP